MKFFYFH